MTKPNDKPAAPVALNLRKERLRSLKVTSGLQSGIIVSCGATCGQSCRGESRVLGV